MPHYRKRTIQHPKQEKDKKRLSRSAGNAPDHLQAKSPHPGALFPGGQLKRVTDEHFGLSARQSALNHLGQTVGNRALQRMVIDPSHSSKAAIQRSVVQRDVWEWVKGKLGSDPEGAVRKMNSSLKRASMILDIVTSSTVGDPALRKKLLALKDGVDNLKTVTSGVVQVLDARDKIGKVWAFALAVESIPDDIAANPEQAARAFGEVFKTAGELGEMLPPGPWTPYFKFLQGAENFFSNMEYGFNPKTRPNFHHSREYLP